jgi:hypothetical protein
MTIRSCNTPMFRVVVWIYIHWSHAMHIEVTLLSSKNLLFWRETTVEIQFQFDLAFCQCRNPGE